MTAAACGRGRLVFAGRSASSPAARDRPRAGPRRRSAFRRTADRTRPWRAACSFFCFARHAGASSSSACGGSSPRSAANFASTWRSLKVAERLAKLVQSFGLRVQRFRPGAGEERELVAQIDDAGAKRVQRRRLVAVESDGARAAALADRCARRRRRSPPSRLRSSPIRSRRLAIALSLARGASGGKAAAGALAPPLARAQSPPSAARRPRAAARDARGEAPSRRDRARGRSGGASPPAPRSSPGPVRRRNEERAARSRALP